MSDQGGKTPPNRTRRTILAAGGCLGATVLAGAAYEYSRPQKPRSEPDGRFRTLTLQWPQPDIDPVFIVARERGFFANYSLEILTPAGKMNGSEVIAGLEQGSVVGGVAPALSWLPHLHGGLPVRLVEGLSVGTFRVLIRDGIGVTRIENLVGKTVAVTDENAADRQFLSILMRRKGINADVALEWVTLPIEHVPGALAEGRISGVVAHDPFAWELLSNAENRLKEMAGSTTGYYGERINRVLGLTTSFLENDPKGSVALVLALRDACRWIEAHRDEVSTLLAHHLPSMDDDAVDAMLAHEPKPAHLLGHWLRDQMAQYADELKLTGRLPDTLDSGDFAKSICHNVLHI